jgi:MHS family proline/betaine transporter-like MFS transporter
MFLGIIAYRPIYQHFLDISSDKNKTEIVEQKEVVRTASLASNNVDSLVKTITIKHYTDGAKFTETVSDSLYVATGKGALKPVVKIEKNVGSGDYWTIIFLIFIQVLFVTMVYGPIAAFLVELFPTRIRYTSMSLPYHIGNGVFGGLVPFISTLIIEYTKTPENPTGTPLAGLWYPIAVAAICLVIGTLYLSNKVDENVRDDENEYIHN